MAKLSRISSIWVAVLGAVACALIASFVLLPAAVLGSPDEVLEPLGPSIATFWESGNAAIPPALSDLVDYWREWHAIKVMICAPLLVAAIAMATMLWSRYLADEHAGGAGSAIGATLSTLLAALVAGLLAINIQATAVPLVALFPQVPADSKDPAVDNSITQLRGSLATGQTSSDHKDVSQFVVDQVGQYTAIIAVAVVVLAVVMGVLTVRLLLRFQRSRGNRPIRVMCAATGLVLGICALGYFAISVLAVISLLDTSSTAAGLLGV